MLKEIEDSICKEYSRGRTTVDIGKELGLHNTTIGKVIRRNKIPIHNNHRNLLFEQEQELIDLYETGMCTTEIGQRYNLSDHTVAILLRRNGVRIKTLSEYTKKHIYNGLFREDNELSFYLAGLIFSDGNVYKNSLQYNISIKDKELSEIFENTFCKKSFITKRNEIYFSVHNTEITKDLERFMIIPNKGKLIKDFPAYLSKEYIHHFVRGCFDGDGSVILNKNGMKRIAMYFSNIEQAAAFQNFVCEETGISKLKIYYGTSYFIAWSKKDDMKKLYDYMYKDATLFLNRKNILYKTFI